MYADIVRTAQNAYLAAFDGNGGVAHEIRFLQLLHDGICFCITGVGALLFAVSFTRAMTAFAAGFAVVFPHLVRVVTTGLGTGAAGFATRAAVLAVSIFVAAGHLLVASPTFPVAMRCETTDEEAGDAEEQTEYEDFGPVGVHRRIAEARRRRLG